MIAFQFGGYHQNHNWKSGWFHGYPPQDATSTPTHGTYQNNQHTPTQQESKMKTYRIYYSTGVNWKCEAVSLRRAMWMATHYQSYACRNDIGWRYRSIEIYEYTAKGNMRTKPIARKVNGTWKKYKQHTNTAGA